jgi:hypothetical protein
MRAIVAGFVVATLVASLDLAAEAATRTVAFERDAAQIANEGW